MKTTMASLEFEQSTLPSDDDSRQRERERTKRRDKPVNNVNKRATMKASFADIKFDRTKNLQRYWALHIYPAFAELPHLTVRKILILGGNELFLAVLKC